jgi:hypothetical protein
MKSDHACTIQQEVTKSRPYQPKRWHIISDKVIKIGPFNAINTGGHAVSVAQAPCQIK